MSTTERKALPGGAIEVRRGGLRRFFTKQPAGFDIPGQGAGWRGLTRGLRASGSFGPASIKEFLNTYGGTDESIVWVYACVSLIAAELASYPYEVTKPGDSDVLTEQEIPEELRALLDKPNKRMTYFDFAEFVAMDLELCGNSYWLKDNMTRDGRPEQLMRLRPDLVEIAVNSADVPVGYAYTIGNLKVPYDLKDVMHYKYPSPLDSDKYGMGTVEAIQRSLGLDLKEHEHITAFFQGGGRLSGIITTERLTEDQWLKMKEDFEEQFVNSTNRLGVLIAETGTSYTPINVAPAGSGVIELRRMGKDEILSGFGVPEFLLGGVGQGGVYRMSEAQFIFGRNMQPKANRYQERTEQDLVLPGWGLNFKVDQTYAEPPDTKIERAGVMLGKGASLNQLLHVQDLPPIDDPVADEPIIQLGFLPWSVAMKTANAQADSAAAAAQQAASMGGGGGYGSSLGGSDGFYAGLDGGNQNGTSPYGTGSDLSSYTGTTNTGDLARFDATAQRGRGSGPGLGGSGSFYAGLSAIPETPALQAPRPRSRHRDAPKPHRPVEGYKSIADLGPIEFPNGYEQRQDSKAKEASQEIADAVVRLQAKVYRDNTEKMRSALHDFFIEQRKRVLHKIGNKSVSADVLLEVGDRKIAKKQINMDRLWNENVEDAALLNAYLPLVDDIGKQAVQGIGKVTGSGLDWTLTNPLVKKMRSILAEKVVRINKTTREKLKDVIEEGMKRGYSIPQIANGVATERYPGIQGVFDAATAARAETIARTETATVYNLAALAGYEEGGIERVEVMDGNYDPVCADANGKIWTLAEATEKPLAHPNAVFEGTYIAALGGVDVGYEAEWSGPAVEIRTATGAWLTVTPNHPVLTGRGWVAASELREGDQVVRRTDEAAPEAAMDLDHMPTPVEEILATLWNRGKSSRVVAAADHFHGDGRFCEGEIYVVRADSPLADVGNVPLVEQEAELVLVGGGVQHPYFARPGSAFLRGGTIPLATAGSMGGSDVSGVSVAAAEFDPALPQALSDDAVADADLLAELERRFACEVALDQVIEVRNIEQMRGQIYDLQTEGRAYFANDLIVSNCVRSFVPLVGKHVHVVEFKGVSVTMGDEVNAIQRPTFTFPESETFTRAWKSVSYADDFSYGDRLMADLAHEFSFDGQSHLVTEAALNVYVSQGEPEMFLAFRHPAEVEEMLAGQPVYTLMVTGNGVYANRNLRRARERAGDQGAIMRATLKPGAKIADLAVVEAQARGEQDVYWKRAQNGDEAARVYYTIARNPGRWAMAEGFDALYDDRHDTYALLNLTALRVQRELIPAAA